SPVNLTGDTFNLSRPNLLPAVYDRLIAGPYNWFDSTTLALILTQFPLELRPNIDDIIDGEDFSNPNWRTPEDAKKNLDTMLAHFIPRAYIGLQLDQVVSSTEDLVDAAAIGLEIAPNPAGEFFTVATAETHRLREVALVDLSGRPVAFYGNLDQSRLRIERGDYPTGLYLVRVRVDEGITTQKIFLR
ncbi:MAG: T9SS type A sorting domain-containing protein, partial [Bacteroidota bacterium]